MEEPLSAKIDDIIKTCEGLYFDLSLNQVEKWKQQTGGKAIGYLPVYVPREVIRAAGMLPVGLMGAGDQLEIIRGDSYYQSYICHLPRSLIEMGLSNRLDALDGMLFPSICDVIRNLSGIWQLLFPEKYAHYFDVPQNFDPKVGGAFYRNELEGLGRDLEQLGGKKVTTKRLNEAIVWYNENLRLVDRLYRKRAEAPWLTPSWECYLLTRAGNLLEVREHNRLLAEYLTEVDRRETRPLDNARVVLVGAFCEQPPLDLIRTLERSGCYIVWDDFLLGSRWLLEPVAEDTQDPLNALVLAYLNNSTETAARFLDRGRKGELLLRQVRETEADGVIFAAPSFCDPALLEQPMLQAALEREGIAYSQFKYAENTGQFQDIGEQAGTFADSIKLWG